MPPWTGRPPERWPATGVFWVEAVAYCAWRQPGGRLPTEDEWEAAARGPEGLRYPWGDKWVRGFANADSQRDGFAPRSEEHTSELQSRLHLVCRLLLEKKK